MSAIRAHCAVVLLAALTEVHVSVGPRSPCNSSKATLPTIRLCFLLFAFHLTLVSVEIEADCRTKGSMFLGIVEAGSRINLLPQATSTMGSTEGNMRARPESGTESGPQVPGCVLTSALCCFHDSH